MSRYAARVIKRFGDTDKAYDLYIKEAENCVPPLEESELKLIWSSALKFGKQVASQEGYIPPEKFNSEMELEPEDYSDVGQAVVLAKEYKDTLRYSPSTDFLVYNGSYWEESKPKAQGVAQELTFKQLEEAEIEIDKTMNGMKVNGALDLIIAMGKKKAENAFNEEQKRNFINYEKALEYKKYAIARRDSRRIASGLKEAQPMLEIEPKDLDSDEFLLNTPTSTYDLRKGISSPMEPDPSNL